jgi:hypothetical protein
MKFYETTFDEYIESSNNVNLHPKLDAVYADMPSDISKMKNIIMYGPSGTGKYTQMLRCIRQYSAAILKYEKKIDIVINKLSYEFKCSDIHFEIDMELLGCKSKTIWFSIYQHIVDIIITKPTKNGIIVCKNFHKIHTELLEHFYSYLHQNHGPKVNVRFIMITTQLSFIPENIIRECDVVRFPRPSKKQYSACIPNMPLNLKSMLVPKHISNIKSIKYLTNTSPSTISTYNPIHSYNHRTICDDILVDLKNIESIQLNVFRDKLYNIFIYNLNIEDCVWYIIQSLYNNVKDLQHFSNILLNTYCFFKYYNNNYRPIYHLEKYMLQLVSNF